jgi:hypothetical protein
LVKTAREGLERPGPADDGAVALRDHEAGRELECERAGIGDAPRHDQDFAVLAGIMQMPGRRRALTKL